MLTEAQKAEGWIEWHGGPQPVPDNTCPDLMFRDGEVAENGNLMSAWHWNWEHSISKKDASYDIIAYKPEGTHHAD